MLDDPGPGNIFIRIIDNSISLIVRNIQLFGLKPDGPVLQVPQLVVIIFIDRPCIDNTVETVRMRTDPGPVICSKLYIYIFQQMADQPRVSAFRYPLPAIVKIIIVICKAKRYAANNKG